jgi:hypothetical protein
MFKIICISTDPMFGVDGVVGRVVGLTVVVSLPEGVGTGGEGWQMIMLLSDSVTSSKYCATYGEHIIRLCLTQT